MDGNPEDGPIYFALQKIQLDITYLITKNEGCVVRKNDNKNDNKVAGMLRNVPPFLSFQVTNTLRIFLKFTQNLGGQ